jgi:hypothetical protein
MWGEWFTSVARVVVLGLCFVLPSACGGALDLSASSSDDVIIEIAKQHQQTVPVKLGSGLAVVPPDTSSEWEISFSSEILTSLTPAEKMRKPGAGGWRFRAAAVGETEVAVTSVVNCDTPPCAPAAIRMVVTVQVKP